MTRCKNCDEYIFNDGQHKCAPAWRCGTVEWDGEDSNIYGTYHAHTPEEAAEKYGEHQDSWSADYSIVGGSPATVIVIGADGKRHLFEVVGETVAQYTARPLVAAQ